MEYASRQRTAIEINGTYYSSFKPATFEGWAKTRARTASSLAVKGSRFCTNRKVLADAGESVAKFVGQGVVALGDRLGPLMWQFMATKKFDAVDFGAFLDLLPRTHEGVTLRHAVQVRHESFAVPEFVALCRKAGVAIVYADSPQYPAIADVTGDFVSCPARGGRGRQSLLLSRSRASALDRGGQDLGLGRAAGGPALCRGPGPRRRCYAKPSYFFIHGGKVRAPAAARN